MQQHPIPQNVTQYQFRLVGDMTLKQFLELALGLLLAYVFYASNLIVIIKWPLIILSILFGAGLAFFPLEDRPLDQWIINFLKVIYAPTRFIWKKTNKIPRLFLFTAHAPEVVNTITKTIKAPSAMQNQASTSDLSEVEATQISALDSIFKQLPQEPAPAVISKIQAEEIEKPSILVRKLKPQSGTVIPPRPAASSSTVATRVKDTVPSTIQTSAPNIIFTAPTAPKTTIQAPMSVPKHITLPASPREPNLITGVVVGNDEKLVENAIVQIVSSDGIPARAMKTNSLGQFYTSTPLSSGTYIIEVDKDNHTFAPQQLVVSGTILSPIELRATS
jgi:hypothetical protein